MSEKDIVDYLVEEYQQAIADAVAAWINIIDRKIRYSDSLKAIAVADFYDELPNKKFEDNLYKLNIISKLAGMSDTEDDEKNFDYFQLDSIPCGNSYISDKYNCRKNYREESTSSFTHDGKTYNLNDALAIADKKPVKAVATKDLDWILEYSDKLDPERVKNADITKPLLITDYKDKLAVIDGIHRLQKAKNMRIKKIPTRYISREELESLPSTRQDAFRIPEWFKQKFEEQLLYFRRKLIIPTLTWKDFDAEQHDVAFTIAGLTRGDLLEDARYLVDKAIDEGNDIETFKRQFKRLIGRKGWKANDSRLYTILDTNSRRSYAAGRYQQAMSPTVMRTRPYLVWIHRDSVVPRENHLALNNKAIPSNHKFWKVAFPTCAYGCRCTAFTANERMLNRMGATILNNPPDPYTIAEKGFQRSAGSMPEKERQEIVENTLARFSPAIAAKVKSRLIAR